MLLVRFDKHECVTVDVEQFSFEASKEMLRPDAQVLTVTNATGGGTLNWQVQKNQACDWLNVYPLSGSCTTEPNEVVRNLHQRMGVILKPEDYQSWLAPHEMFPRDLDHLLLAFGFFGFGACNHNNRHFGAE